MHSYMPSRLTWLSLTTVKPQRVFIALPYLDATHIHTSEHRLKYVYVPGAFPAVSLSGSPVPDHRAFIQLNTQLCKSTMFHMLSRLVPSHLFHSSKPPSTTCLTKG